MSELKKSLKQYKVKIENLAFPEVHIDPEDHERTSAPGEAPSISYDNLAIPEIHCRKKTKLP